MLVTGIWQGGRGGLFAVGLALLGALSACSSPAAAPSPDPYGDRTMLDDGPTTTYTGTQTTITSSLRPMQTVRVKVDDLGLVFDRTELACHGGTAQVTWHIGDLEPTSPGGVQLTARLDEKPIGSIIRAGNKGIYDDAPATLEAVTECPKGQHVLDMQITYISASVGLPFAGNIGETAPPERMTSRGFVVLEVWN